MVEKTWESSSVNVCGVCGRASHIIMDKTVAEARDWAQPAKACPLYSASVSYSPHPNDSSLPSQHCKLVTKRAKLGPVRKSFRFEHSDLLYHLFILYIFDSCIG